LTGPAVLRQSLSQAYSTLARQGFQISTDIRTMTYGIAMLIDEGLVVTVDSRTHAGVDHVSTYRKVTFFEIPGERAIFLMNSGNLSVSQSVVNLLSDGFPEPDRPQRMMTATTMLDAAKMVGAAIREVYRVDATDLRAQGIDHSVLMILGGQIKGDRMRLFQIYSAGNFIEASPDTPYFLIGEMKYGKPIIDRVIRNSTPLNDALKCTLISMDSTMRSNVSVGLPLDVAAIRRDTFRFAVRRRIEDGDGYFDDLRRRWGEGLRSVFESMPGPTWCA
jgi:putative proteasome-type protease